MPTGMVARERVVFDLELERVRVRALRAFAAGRDEAVATLDSRLAQVERALADAAEARAAIGLRLGLGADQLAAVWAIAAATVDPALALHVGELGPRLGRGGISLAQITRLLGWEPARGTELAMALAGSHPLVALGLIEATEDGPITAVMAFTAAPRLVAFLAGRDGLDPDLAGCGGLVASPGRIVSDGERDGLVSRVRTLLGDADRRAIVLLEGRRGHGRRTIASEACPAPLVALDLERTPRGPRGLARALAALGRETMLRGAIPLVAGIEDVAGGDADAVGRRHELLRFLEGATTPVVLTAGAAPPAIDTDRPVVRFEVPLPVPRTRAALWRAYLPAESSMSDDDVAGAALRFRLGPGSIAAAASAATALAAARGGVIEAADLAEGVRTTVDARLHGLARRHATHLGWTDLVLPEDTRVQIDLLLARVRHAYRVLEEWGYQRHLPGSGVAALFSGPPGTGKTMVAGIIARELGLDLYRVDLSQVVSKWVGETEKQLDQVFAAADVGHVVLLFDEADALFAKRTEVKGATERYANMEVNFLLQRLESFGGIAILTTNMDGSLDPAFRRRLAGHIQFPQPDEDERAHLWRVLVPAEAPLAADVDPADLAADYPGFAGAHIRNALTTAAFLAAAAGTSITQALLHRAAQEESRAMGRMVRSEGRL
jgi:hypothetical protein